jgi:hypothetical protein
VLGLIWPKALAQRPRIWLRVEAEKSDWALPGQPNPWPQSTRVFHAKPASKARLGVVTARSPERRCGRWWLTSVLGALGSVVKAWDKYGECARQPYVVGSSPGRVRIEWAVETTWRDVLRDGDDSAVADGDAWVVLQP